MSTKNKLEKEKIEEGIKRREKSWISKERKKREKKRHDRGCHKKGDMMLLNFICYYYIWQDMSEICSSWIQ